MRKRYSLRRSRGILFASLSIILLLSKVVYAWQLPVDRDYDNEHPVWGKETNGLKAGLVFQYSPDTNHTLIAFCPVLFDVSNDMHLYLPPFDSRYQMTLTDTKGMAVFKTAKCKALGKPIDKPLRGRTGINSEAGYRSLYLALNTPSENLYDSFILTDYFEINHAGKYHLQFDMAVIWPSQKYPTNVVHLPPVNAEIEFKKP